MQIQATACGLVGRLTESSCNHQPEVLQCKRKVSVSEPDPNHSIEVCLAGCTQAESYRLTCGIAGPAILLFDLCLASSLGRSLSDAVVSGCFQTRRGVLLVTPVTSMHPFGKDVATGHQATTPTVQQPRNRIRNNDRVMWVPAFKLPL